MKQRNDYRAIGINKHRAVKVACLFVLLILTKMPSAVVFAQIFNETIIEAPDPVNGERFGHSMAIDGKYIVFGASGVTRGTGIVKGRAFVYKYKEGKWKKQATLSYNQSQVGDALGHSVAIYNDWVVVGAPHPFDDGSNRSGRVLIYEQPKDGWKTTSKPDWVLLPDGNGGIDSFGSAVAIAPVQGSNDLWIIVGASQDDRTKKDAGVFYVYRKINDTISLKQIIESPDPLANENFGSTLRIDNDLLVIGAPSLPHTQTGSVHTYILSGNNKWVHQQTISGFDSQKGDHFGRSVSVWRDDQKQNGWLVIGATGDDDFGEHSGSAYIYQWVRQGQNWGWKYQQKFTDSKSQNGDHIGFSSSISNDLMAIGAPFPGGGRNNVLYILQYFQKSNRWKQVARHESIFPDSVDYTGISMTFHIDKNGIVTELLAGKPQREINGVAEAGAVLILNQ